MNKKDFQIYREGHLEGYEIGLRDGIYIEKKLKYFSEGFIVGALTGIGIFVMILIILKNMGVL